MNPRLAEELYYLRILNYYKLYGIQNRKDFEIFAYRELLSILNEEKDPDLSRDAREELGWIRTNTILLILALNAQEKLKFSNYPEPESINPYKSTHYLKGLMVDLV